jgi:hypothetical protein
VYLDRFRETAVSSKVRTEYSHYIGLYVPNKVTVGLNLHERILKELRYAKVSKETSYRGKRDLT